VLAPGGRPRTVVGFTIARDRVVEIEPRAEPERLPPLDLVIVED
jgi:hypothetical protein